MNSKEHTKYFNKDNTEVPSVTSVIKLLDKPQLVGWANYLGFKNIKVQELLETKANYGTMVHDMFETYMTSITVPNYDNQEELQLRVKFKHIRDELTSKGFDMVNMELQLHGQRVGGTLDLLVKHRETGKYLLLDLKTSKDIYPSMYIQLGGYSLLLKEVYNIDVSAVGIILISKEVTNKKFFCIRKREDNLNNEEIFNKLLDIYYLLE